MTNPLLAELRRRAADPSLRTDEPAELPRPEAHPLDGLSISRAEAALGYRLPALLRDVYLHVGNGGFGPGYGLLPLLSDDESPPAETAIELYAAFRSTDPEDPAWSWPAHLLPFCDWGCAIRSCIDCSSPHGTVVTFDPNVRGIGEPMSNAFTITHDNLHAWFTEWTLGVKIWERMFEPDSH